MSPQPTYRPFRTDRRAYGPTQGGFRNVDLDIAGPLDLAPLVRSLHRKLFFINATAGPRQSFLTAELRPQPRSADAAILALARTLSRLRGTPLALWRRCPLRSFNIGYDACSAGPALGDAISAAAIESIQRVGADLAITIYPPDPDR